MKANKFRPEIQGLRALAVLLVLAFHARLGAFSGGFVGVDVFFVISGFLITSLLLEEYSSTGAVDFVRFYARRLQRLLPAVLLVLVVVVPVYSAVLSPLETKLITSTAIATVFYLSNVWFASTATDYLGGDAKEDPLLHTWSLGVEEQFYMFWPLVLVLLLRHVSGVSWRAGIFWSLALASFSVSVVLSHKVQPWAFFLLPARAWEFALGAMLALPVLPQASSYSRYFWECVGLSGLALIIFSATSFTQFVLFPGYLAVIPTLGTALVILACNQSRDSWVTRTLSLKPLRWIGDISYSLYLWHWPFLVMLYTFVKDPSPLETVAVCAGAIVAAGASYHLVENPIRRIRWSNLGRLGLAAGLSAVALVVLIVIRFDVTRASLTPEQAVFAAVKDDTHAYLTDLGCYVNFFDVEPTDCTLGAGEPSSRAKIAVFGDSHAAHWISGLHDLSAQESVSVIPVVKSACPSLELIPFDPNLGRPYIECKTWRDSAVESIRLRAPDVVILSNSEAYFGAQAGSGERIKPDVVLTAIVEKLPGHKIAIIRDIPRPRFDVPVCHARIAHHGNSLERLGCTYEFKDALSDQIHLAAEKIASQYQNVEYFDYSDLFCPTLEICETRVDEHFLYFDSNHMTATQSKLLAPRLLSDLKERGMLPNHR